MVFPISLLWLFVAAMVISSIGFKNYVWFISLGYGFSIAGEGILMLILYGKTLQVDTVLCCALFVLYGLRLGGYLAIREAKSSSYKKNMTGEIKDGKTIPFGVKIAIWITCAALYVTQVSAVLYRLENNSETNVWAYVGAAVMALGLVLETAADIQKNNAKKINPRRFVDTGLYRLVRCPNYLGEILMWWGIGLSAFFAMDKNPVMLLGAFANTLLFLFISIPLAEGHQSRKEGFEQAERPLDILKYI